MAIARSHESTIPELKVTTPIMTATYKRSSHLRAINSVKDAAEASTVNAPITEGGTRTSSVETRTPTACASEATTKISSTSKMDGFSGSQRPAEQIHMDEAMGARREHHTAGITERKLTKRGNVLAFFRCLQPDESGKACTRT